MYSRIAPLSAIALVCLTAIATTANAQSFPMPNLDFPDKQTEWGCKLSNSCPATPDDKRVNG